VGIIRAEFRETGKGTAGRCGFAPMGLCSRKPGKGFNPALCFEKMGIYWLMLFWLYRKKLFIRYRAKFNSHTANRVIGQNGFSLEKSRLARCR
jgi:hypothetical protein